MRMPDFWVLSGVVRASVGYGPMVGSCGFQLTVTPLATSGGANREKVNVKAIATRRMVLGYNSEWDRPPGQWGRPSACGGPSGLPQNRKQFRPLHLQKPRVEQPLRIHIAHGRKHVLLHMRILFLQFAENPAQRPPHGARAQGTIAWRQWHGARLGISPRDILRHEDQRTDQPELPVARVSDGRQRAQPSREQRI